MNDAVSAMMIDHRSLKVLAHPVRVEILRHLLAKYEATPAAFSEAFGIPLGVVSYHFRRLRDARQIVLSREVPVRGAVAHYYRLSSREGTDRLLGRATSTAQPTHGAVLIPGDPSEPVQYAVGYLRLRREGLGISLGALARRIGIDPSDLASIERGETDPRSTVLTRIALELGTTIGQVFTHLEM